MTLSRRSFLASVCVTAMLLGSQAEARFPRGTATGVFPFQPLRVGGGGFITGMDIANDGTKVCRCDSFGAYISIANGPWQQLCTTSRMPLANQGALTGSGVYEIRLAPNNSQVIYMFYGLADSTTLKPWLFVSTNRGASFTKMSNWTLVNALANPGNGEVRGFGPKAAVDPNNADDFITTNEAGTTLETTNGTSGATATFSSLSTVPTGTVNTCGCVAFDPSSGTTGSPARTNVCYVSSWGNGLYVRTTPTGSFSLVTGTAGMQITRLKVASNGNVFFITGTTSGGTTLRRLTWSAGPGSTPTVTDITPASLVGVTQNVLLDPSSATHITAISFNNGIADSTNSGTSWSAKNTNITSTAPNAPYLITGVIGNQTEFSTEILADPNSPSNIYFPGFQGMFTTTYPIKASGVNQACTDFTLGIEQMAANSILLTPNDSLAILQQQDWGIMKSGGPNTAPTVQGWDTGQILSSCWHADWASTNPALIVTTMSLNLGNDTSVKNTNNGIGAGTGNWTATTTDQYGSIAAYDNNNWLHASAFTNSGQLYLTANGGTTWTQVTAPAGNASATTGWGTGGAFNSWRCVAADRVNGVLYAFHPMQGLFSYNIATTTWTSLGNAAINTGGGYGYLKSVPNIASTSTAGHLFFSSYGGSGGSYTGPNTANRFYRTTNGGSTWSIVGPSSVTATGAIVEVWAFGFGAPAPGQSYPAIYIYGWIYNGTTYVQGIYRSIDNAVTWTQLTGAYPDGWLDWNKDLDADKLIYGRVYTVKSGSSFSVGQYA